jgi:hypothetical protein
MEKLGPIKISAQSNCRVESYVRQNKIGQYKILCQNLIQTLFGSYKFPWIEIFLF